MKVKLAYGRSGLEVELPEKNVVKCLEHRSLEPLADPTTAVKTALTNPIGTEPLAKLAAGRRNACILISDITRPVPNEVILRPLLAGLQESGMTVDNILILVATGLHRPNTKDELVEMLGSEIASTYRVENHFGQELEQHTFLGNSPRGIPAWIDSRYVEADLKIATGLIEPHFMAGYSGGRKAICPGIAAMETIRPWHSPALLEDPHASSGHLDGNPVHEEGTAIAEMAGCDLIVNVVIDSLRRTVAVVAGDLRAAHLRGTDLCRNLVTDSVPQPVDIVLTSSAGYPLDTTFYQSVKGMVAALPIIKQGGRIILAGKFSEGIGSNEFRSLFKENDTLDSFMQRITSTDYFVMDQWQLEELAKARRKAKVTVVSEGLASEVLEGLFVDSAETVEAAVAAALEEHGSDATIAVIPDGPYVMVEVE